MNGILLMGPTASGKSALAMKVAETFPVEIISVDSAQVYRGMDVGTAKPTLPERARVPHHLIDIVSPLERYSAAAFARDARRLVGEISGRGNMPLLVGGTMLYFKALIEGLSDLPEADASVRAFIDARAAEIGWHEMHKELRAVDPVTAARLDPADRQRIQRALEVFRITRRPLSELIAGGRAPDDLSFLKIALIPSERSALHQRIAERFDGILASGLVDELRALREDHPELHPDMPAMRAVGYRQAWKYLNGDIDYVTLRNQGIFATRQLAKRQLTWLRAMTADTYDCLATDVDARVIGAIAVSIGKSDRSVPGFHAMTMVPGAIDA